VRQFKALGVLKKIDSNIFCYLNSKTLKKETKKTLKNLPKKTKKMEGEDRHQLLLSNEFYDSFEEDNGEYRSILLTAKEYQDALVWDIEDLVETMNKLAI
tara:strand:+ start:173 stop:472 length:300 start_codon:yes stop_codon:yes gene_type:complete